MPITKLDKKTTSPSASAYPVVNNDSFAEDHPGLAETIDFVDYVELTGDENARDSEDLQS